MTFLAGYSSFLVPHSDGPPMTLLVRPCGGAGSGPCLPSLAVPPPTANADGTCEAPVTGLSESAFDYLSTHSSPNSYCAENVALYVRVCCTSYISSEPRTPHLHVLHDVCERPVLRIKVSKGRRPSSQGLIGESAIAYGTTRLVSPAYKNSTIVQYLLPRLRDHQTRGRQTDLQSRVLQLQLDVRPTREHGEQVDEGAP